MKTRTSSRLRFIALAATLSLALVSARAEVSELRVGVRASVDYRGMKKPTDEQLQQDKAHQSIYVISQVRLVEPIHKTERLVNPSTKRPSPTSSARPLRPMAMSRPPNMARSLRSCSLSTMAAAG